MSDTTILQNSTQVKKYPHKALIFIYLLNYLPTYCLTLRMQKKPAVFTLRALFFLCDLCVRVRLSADLQQPDSGGFHPRCGFLRFTLQERRKF